MSAPFTRLHQNSQKPRKHESLVNKAAADALVRGRRKILIVGRSPHAFPTFGFVCTPAAGFDLDPATSGPRLVRRGLSILGLRAFLPGETADVGGDLQRPTASPQAAANPQALPADASKLPPIIVLQQMKEPPQAAKSAPKSAADNEQAPPPAKPAIKKKPKLSATQPPQSTAPAPAARDCGTGHPVRQPDRAADIDRRRRPGNGCARRQHDTRGRGDRWPARNHQRHRHAAHRPSRR